jgi:isopropylmalate/homocitrate/citramalate synthase
MGKCSGIDSVKKWLDDAGLVIEDEQKQMELVQKVKESAISNKRLLTREEFSDLAKKVQQS